MSFFVRLPPESYPALLPPGFDASDTFSFPTAQAMMWLSQLSYEEDATIDTLLARWNLQPPVHLRSPAGGLLTATATRGFVCRSDAATIVAFAGTDPGILSTVLTDLQTKPDGDGMHPGFRRALDAVWAQVIAAIPRNFDGRVLLAGHSLGAALAVLTAFRLHTEHGVNAKFVYTFGLPRVGGDDFGAAYEPAMGATTFRFVNGDDPVPSIPPSFLGYRHIGRALVCPHGGLFDPMAAPAAVRDNDPNFAAVETRQAGHALGELLRGRWPAPAQPGLLGKLYALLPGGLADHLPARYLRALGTPVPP